MMRISPPSGGARYVGAGLLAIGVVRLTIAGCSPFGAGDATSGTNDASSVDAVATSGDGGEPERGPCDADLCTNFDPPVDTPPFGWDRVGDHPDAGLRFVLLGTGRSPPNALQLSVDVDGGREGSLYLEKSLGTPDELTLSLAVRIEALASKAGRAVRIVEVACGSKTIARVKINTSGKLFVDGDDEGIEVSPAVLPLGAWQTVGLHLTAMGAPDGGTVTVTRVESNESNTPAALEPCVGEVRLRVGNIVDDDGAGIYVVSLDDVITSWR